jgi:N-methylhydantoinase A
MVSPWRSRRLPAAGDTARAQVRIGVEVGGTFTDWVVMEDDRVARIGKVLSTPPRPEVGVLEALKHTGIATPDVAVLVHGSTIATNVVLERKGAPTILVTTQGFRDVLGIQRQAKQRLFDLFYRQPEPLVPRDRIVEVEEKVGPDGETRRPLQMDGLLDTLDALIHQHGVTSLAVCLLHSYANPAHERRIETAIAERFPGLHISLSSEVLPQLREYERTSTVVMSAYTRPAVDCYLGQLEARLAESGFTGQFNVIQANGGTVPAHGIRRHAVKMILSGPAAGVIGATAVAADAGFDNIITYDMGGTSSDVCLVNDGQPKITTDYKIDGLPLALPMIDVATVGAGGGSIVSVDAGGIMKVGPASAGADPGPACYGRGGTEFTVTDANALLGLIRPHMFFGGRLRLDLDAAARAAERVGGRLGMSVFQTAEGVRHLVNFTMAQAMRLVSVERGHDPRDYTVVAYGGGGPLHGAQLAEELGCGQVVIPRNPGVISALGLLIAGTQQDFMATHLHAAPQATRASLQGTFAALEGRARTEFEGYGIPWHTVELEYFLDMRYRGQAYELTMPVDDFVVGDRPAEELSGAFHEFHRRRYGHASSREGVEIVNFRLSAARRSPLRHVPHQLVSADAKVEAETQEVYLAGAGRPCRFYKRASLPAGASVGGPAVVEEPTATTFIPDAWTGTVDGTGNLILQRCRT